MIKLYVLADSLFHSYIVSLPEVMSSYAVLSFMLIFIQQSVSLPSPPVKTVTNETTKNATTNLDNICDLCICSNQTLDCTNRAVTKNLTEYSWPANLTKALFINSSIERIVQFPQIEIDSLVIRDNCIKSIGEAAFKQIKSLKELDLGSNNLTADILLPDQFEGKFSPDDYQPLPDLMKLNLSNNRLERLNQDLFLHMRGVKHLILSKNPLKVLDEGTEKAVSTPVSLEQLDLSSCQLKELHHKLDYMIMTLKVLKLENNSFESPPAVLQSAKNLETLVMDSNPISLLNKASAFPTMLNLKTLSINNMPNLMKIDAGSLSDLPALQHLYVANCPKLFYISGDALVNHNNTRAYVPLLKTLELSNNSLQHLSLEMAQWDKLEELHLMNNQWSCDCDNDDLIHSFIPHYGSSLLKAELDLLVCSNPADFRGRKLAALNGVDLPCQNVYYADNTSEAIFLVGMLIGVLLAVPILYVIFLSWRKGFLVCGSKPASYSRAFYKRAANDAEY